MKSAICSLGVLAAVALPFGPSDAAAEWPVSTYNPSPLDGDLVLPMPCGGGMVFRKVAVPDAGFLEDYRIALGSLEQERGYAEYRRNEWVAGAFSTDGGKGTRHYYIGKYEVSRLQQDSLGAECPEPKNVDLQKPATRITWSEASVFAERYSDWLIRNYLEGMPKEDGVPGFLRLPTETEWEFAARGALKVGATAFAERLPFPAAEIDNYVVHDSNSYKELDLIGTRNNNPLGLHDMLGNAAELTVDLFRLNAVNRLHGRAGGFVVRGGSYRTRKSDIRLSHREEFAPMDSKGIRRLDTVGFRLVLAAPALPSREAIEQAQRAWEALTKETGELLVDMDLGREQSDPVKEARALAKAAPTPEMKRRLENLSLVIAESIKTRNEQRSRAILELLHGTAVAANLLVNDLGRLGARKRLIRDDLSDDLKAAAERRYRQAEGEFDFNFNYYLDRLPTLAVDYSHETLMVEALVLKGQYRERGLEALPSALDATLEHLEANRRLGPAARSEILASLKDLAGR